MYQYAPVYTSIWELPEMLPLAKYNHFIGLCLILLW